MDDQVKVRGVRIELGDVTAALMKCESVREAVVLAEPDGEGSNRLRAWVTLKKGIDGDESTIRSSLMEMLPGYMVPFRIHVIEAIPLTPHGKSDQRALRAMAENDTEGAEGLPLNTSTEHRLAAIWSELLGVEVQYRDADFFRLGGHSLIAMRLSARIRKDFGVSTNLPDFYSDGRLDSLAASIDRERGRDYKSNGDGGDRYKTYTIWKKEGPLKVYSFFMAINKLRRMAALCRWDWSVVELSDPQIQRGEKPDLPIERLAPVYADAILKEHVEGPIVLIGNCFTGMDAYATARLLQQTTRHPIHIVMFDTRYPGKPDRQEQAKDRRIRTSHVFSRMLENIVTEGFRMPQGKGDWAFKARNFALRALLNEALNYRLIDPEWYLAHYPDLSEAGIDPIQHYFNFGWIEKRQPSLTFNATLYRSICPDFHPTSRNPVLHYLTRGRFNASVRRSVRELHISAADAERIMASDWFDSDWYAREYPTVEYHGRTPLSHFMAFGWRLGRKPYPEYDPAEFSMRFPGFEPGKANPLRHLLSLPRIPHRSVDEKSKDLHVPSFSKHQVDMSAESPATDPNQWRHARLSHDADHLEVINARIKIRNRYRPEQFKGDLYLLVNQFLHDEDPTNGWRNGTYGRFHSIRMDGDHDSYLIDDLKSNAGKVDAVLRGILKPGTPA
jgi:hypothetical protein